MNTKLYTNAYAVILIAACFPFSGTRNEDRNQLRKQHFKRKQNE